MQLLSSLILVAWMQSDAGVLMTMQSVDPMQCGELRAGLVMEPGVIHAMCIGDPLTIGTFTAEGECTVLEMRETFVNLTCKRVPEWKHQRR